MDFMEAVRGSGSNRRLSATLIAATIAALAMAIASPAQAHTPYVAKAWGLNTSGQLGDGTTTGPEKCGPPKMQQACSTTPVSVSGLSGVVAVAGGPAAPFSNFGLALREGGTVMAWGPGGKLGDGSKASDVPVAVCAVGTVGECPSGPFLEGVAAISAGEEHALALLSNGTVMAWGSNGFGQLGNGTNEGRNVPEAVCAVGATSPCSEASQQLKEVIAIAAGGEHSLALLSNHTVVAWGQDFFGALGNGTSESSNVPVEVSGLKEAVAIAAGFRHSLAMLSNGTVKAWGQDTFGALGNGTETNSHVPVAVSGLTGVTGISAGMHHSLALLSGGTVKAWGSNENGQLGDGTSVGPEACGLSGACSKTPVAVCAGSPPGPCPPNSFLGGVSAISAGGRHSLALLSAGTVKAWGENGSGQLGDGTSEGPEPCGPAVCSTTPVEVNKLVDVKGIAGGGLFSLAFGPPPPGVTAVSPKEGPRVGGTSVTITGTAFEEVLAVKFGSANATSFKVNSEGSIMATSPPGSGTVDVTVTTPAGTSAPSSADEYSYVHVAGVEPDFGRCVEAAVVKEGKKLHYGGAFKDPGCTKPNKAKRGQYEWLPEAGGTFTSVLNKPALETTGKSKVLISCASGKAKGQYTGPSTFKVTKLVFSGCAESPSKGLASECQNKGSTNGEIKANELAGELGFIKHPKNKKGTKGAKVGLDLRPASASNLASFECGGANEVTGEGSGTGTARELEGSVIGRVANINAMTSTNTVTYEASGGQQSPEFFEGGVKDTLRMNSEPTVFTASEEVKNSEELEINTKF
jgi:alpha-tubulin suppressor-like RCC1 family protein